MAVCCACGGGERAPADADGGPRRVAVLAPAAAEMLDTLGVLDRVVGIGEFGPWPDGLAELPVIGGYDSPNPERVLELRCDAVVTAASDAGAAAHERLESLGVRVITLDTDTWDGVFDSLRRLGAEFGREDRAGAAAEAMRARLDEVARRAADLRRRRVLVVVGRDPLYVAGPGSHLDRLIELAGGVNVAGDPGPTYRRMSLEAVLERAPEVIVDTSDNGADAPRGRTLGAWERWGVLPAVRDRRVYHVAPGRLVIPGMRLPDMADLMARLIHPETFGAIGPDDGGPTP